MLKIAITAALMLSPATLLAQSSAPMGAGMGTQADAAPRGGMTTVPSAGHAGTRSTMHHGRGHHTTRGASPSNDTMSTPNSSNSKSSTLNPMPH